MLPAAALCRNLALRRDQSPLGDKCAPDLIVWSGPTDQRYLQDIGHAGYRNPLKLTP